MLSPMHTQEDCLAKLQEISYSPKGYVSNWFSNMTKLDVPLTYEGVVYHTAENFYQAMKIDPTRVDCFYRRTEIAAMNCYESKTCFRKNNSLYRVRPDWTSGMKIRMMKYILVYKYAPCTSWYEKLIATKDEPIIEFNNWGDTFWGFDIKQMLGQNHLGKLLMKIRARYVNQALENFMQ